MSRKRKTYDQEPAADTSVAIAEPAAFTEAVDPDANMIHPSFSEQVRQM